MEKSHVSLEQKVCICCSERYDTNAILLDRRLRASMNHHTTTGIGLCDSCKKEGYVLLIECDPERSKITNGVIKPQDAYKTGVVVHIKKEVFKDIFNIAEPTEFAFVDPECVQRLQQMKENSNGNNATDSSEC